MVSRTIRKHRTLKLVMVSRKTVPLPNVNQIFLPPRLAESSIGAGGSIEFSIYYEREYALSSKSNRFSTN